MRKISLFIATSLDGYIAKPNDDLSFLKLVENEGEDYGYAEFMSNIDTIILGGKPMIMYLKKLALHITTTDNAMCMLLQELQNRVLGEQLFTQEN